MTIWKKAVIVLFVLGAIIGGLLYFLNEFISSFEAPKIEITKDHLTTDRDFINGITIEQIRVDSIGEAGYPVKYTTVNKTSCNIEVPENGVPDPPSKIRFNEPGNYTWDKDTVNVDHVHKGLSRTSASSSDKPSWSYTIKGLKTCPLEIRSKQWYYFIIGNQEGNGIFYFVDKDGEEHRYAPVTE